MPLSVSEACLSFLMAGLVVILQPYKNFPQCDRFFVAVLHDGHRCLILLLLIFMSILISVLYILFIVVFIYLVYRLLKCCCCCKKQQSQTIVAQQNSPEDVDDPRLVPERRPLIQPTTSEVRVVLGNDYVPDDLYPDRMVNPRGYREQHCQYQPLEESILHENYLQSVLLLTVIFLFWLMTFLSIYVSDQFHLSNDYYWQH